MAVSLPNGSTVAIASGYGSAKVTTVVTNASEAVVTSAAHGYSNGDFIEFTSGWSKATNKVFRIKSVATDTFVLEGFDSSSTTNYPAASGVGTVRKVTGFTQLAQITGSSSTGGEQQFLTYQFLEDDAEKRIPTNKSAAGVTFTVADDPSLPGYIIASTANDDRAQRAIKITLSNSSIILYNSYVSLSTIPSLTVNELMTVEATLSLLASPVRYAS